jgi:hypothetical protein
MSKLIRVSLLVLVGAIAIPRVASAELTYRELRQTIRAADYYLNVEFPLSAAVECDQQRHGASGTWDADSRCNVELERLAALVSLVTGGTFFPADIVTAWCSAAEIVNSAKEAFEVIRRGPDMSQEARNQRAWEALPPYQQGVFMMLNTTLGFIMPLIGFDE